MRLIGLVVCSLFGRGGVWFVSLKCEVIVFVVGYGPYPSSVEVDWLYCLGGIVRLREEFGTSLVD